MPSLRCPCGGLHAGYRRARAGSRTGFREGLGRAGTLFGAMMPGKGSSRFGGFVANALIMSDYSVRLARCAVRI